MITNEIIKDLQDKLNTLDCNPSQRPLQLSTMEILGTDLGLAPSKHELQNVTIEGSSVSVKKFSKALVGQLCLENSTKEQADDIADWLKDMAKKVKAVAKTIESNKESNNALRIKKATHSLLKSKLDTEILAERNLTDFDRQTRDTAALVKKLETDNAQLHQTVAQLVADAK